MPPFVSGIVPLIHRVCPWDKPGEIGLPLCRIRRKPGFVPGFHRVCPRDKPGEIPGTNPGSSQDQPDKKVYVYVPFSCLICFANFEFKWGVANGYSISRVAKLKGDTNIAAYYSVEAVKMGGREELLLRIRNMIEWP